MTPSELVRTITRGFAEKRVREQERYLKELEAKRSSMDRERYEALHQSASARLEYFREFCDATKNIS